MSVLLEVSHLQVSYGEARALDDVSFAVAQGSLFAIVGSNGAGKTSLVRAIGGMLRPGSGWINFDGVDTTRFDSSQTCELGIGQVAEGRQIFPSLSVEENLGLGSALKRAVGRQREISLGSTICFRGCMNDAGKKREHCRAVSSKCSR